MLFIFKLNNEVMNKIINEFLKKQLFYKNEYNYYSNKHISICAFNDEWTVINNSILNIR